MNAARDLPVSLIRQVDGNEVVTLVTAGQCLRRGTELRMLGLGQAGGNLYAQNWLQQAGNLEIAAQAD